MKQPSTPPHPPKPLPQTPASRYLPDIAPDIAITEIHWSVLLRAGANSSLREKGYASRASPCGSGQCPETSPLQGALTQHNRTDHAWEA